MPSTGISIPSAVDNHTSFSDYGTRYDVFALGRNVDERTVKSVFLCMSKTLLHADDVLERFLSFNSIHGRPITHTDL